MTGDIQVQFCDDMRPGDCVISPSNKWEVTRQVSLGCSRFTLSLSALAKFMSDLQFFYQLRCIKGKCCIEREEIGLLTV